MLTFTLFPTPCAPLGSRIRYAVASDTPTTIRIRIRRVEDRTLLGVKRFVGVENVELDPGPYIERILQFEPSSGGTGFCDGASRTVAIVVEAEADNGETATSPVCRILPGDGTAAASEAKSPSPAAGAKSAPLPATSTTPTTSATPDPQADAPCSAPALMTAMPRERTIAPDECDELTLVHEGPLTVTVTASAAGEPTFEAYRTEAGGLHLFRLDTRDFPGAERLSVDAGACGKVDYTLLPAPEGARRLAWRTAAGSIEHYTFPVEREVTVATARQRVRSPDGWRTEAVEEERRIRLESAFERPEMLDALSGILSSTQVWLVDGDACTPVDVATDRAVVRRHGTLNLLAIEIRSTDETPLRWN